VLHFPHPTKKKHKRIHRLVVLPDYQGIGVGKSLLNYVAEDYRKQGFTVSIVTSAFNLVMALQNSPNWNCIRKGRTAIGRGTVHNTSNRASSGNRRITVSFEYKL